MFGRSTLHDVDCYRVDRSYFVNPTAVTKCDANELPHEPPGFRDWIVDAVQQTRLHRYPDPEALELREMLAARLGLGPEHVLLGNGSDELISYIFLCHFGGKLVIPDVTYPVYAHCAAINEISVTRTPLDLPDFTLNPVVHETIARVDPDLVCLSFPNNPTGNCFAPDLVQALVDAFPRTLFVLDEAYYEFSGKTLIQLATDRPNVVVLRTLSKAHGLAGLRLGYAVSRPENIAVLRKVKLPYNVNALSQAVAIRLLREAPSSLAATVAAVVEERTRVARAIGALPSARVVDSEANFVFARFRGLPSGPTIQQTLTKRAIAVRYWGQLRDGDYFRITIGSPEQNDRLLNVLRDLPRPAAYAQDAPTTP